MISINGVSKTYGNDKKAVDNLTLEVKSGEIFGFLGPNGAGKSTTIKMLTGILKADCGTISIDGIDVSQEPIKAKSLIGYVPDNHETYETLTGYEYLHFLGVVYSVPKDTLKQRIDYYADMFKMKEALSDYISSYSHGMKQKIMVIGAMIHQPKVWILDEPLTGLDPQSAHDLKTLMRQHADAGNTVFFSSHIIDVVEKVCDRIAIINHGRLVAVDTLEALRESGEVSLEQLFLDVTQQ